MFGFCGLLSYLCSMILKENGLTLLPYIIKRYQSLPTETNY